MMERTKTLIRKIHKVWKKAMANGWVRIGVMLLPFILAMIGYMLYFEGSILFSVYSALKVYAGGFEPGFHDVKFTKEAFAAMEAAGVNKTPYIVTRVSLEIARWMGLCITGTFLFRFIREQAARLEAERKARQEDTIAVHGSAHYEALLGNVLGKQAITKNIPEKFEAKRHVLAFESDADLMKYLGEHFLQFEAGEDKQIYLCMRSASHTKYSREGFVINNMAENCARLYWRHNYIRRHGEKMERRIALIGFGHYGQALLSQALMVNVFAKGTPGMEYHVFGDSKAYCSLHRGIRHFASINEHGDGDSVFFHEHGWESELDLLRGMDRVILCSDEDEENIRVLGTLEEELAQAAIHIRCRDARMLKALYAERRGAKEDLEANVFGTDQRLYTREMILHEKLLEMAKRIHARYMCTQDIGPCRNCPTRGKTAPCIKGCGYFYENWNNLGVFLQRSNICAADHMEVKLREMIGKDCRLTEKTLGEYMACLKARCDGEEAELYRELEHRRWMRYCFFSGWNYADIPKKDTAGKRHPLLKPYEELPEQEKTKDMDAYMMLCDLQRETVHKD